MTFENSIVRLSDLCSDISYGYTASATTNKIGPKFLRITDIQGGDVSWDSVPYCEISPRDLEKNKLVNGDIVIARTGNSTGENYIFNSEEETVFASYLIRFRINPELANPYFVWLQLRTQEWWIFVIGAKTGSAQAGANAKVLGQFEFFLPERAIQDLIASKVLVIYQKLKLNTQTNQTLESIAQTIFKSWFVDFEPVKAKMAALAEGGTREQAELAAMSAISGKNEIELAQMQKENFEHYSQLAETAALFPSAMVESELGEIPEGWEVVGFSDIVSKYIDNRGKTPPTQETGIPLLEVKHLPDGSIKPDLKTDKFVDKDTYENWFRAHLESDDLIMSTVGTIGRLCMVPPNSKMAIAQNLLGLRFNRSKVSPYFMYYQMNDFRFKNDVDARLVITVQASIKRKDLETIDLLSAPIVLQEKFELFIKPFVLSQHSNENQNLAELRDSLLPKLLSGEIDLSEIQSEVA